MTTFTAREYDLSCEVGSNGGGASEPGQWPGPTRKCRRKEYPLVLEDPKFWDGPHLLFPVPFRHTREFPVVPGARGR